MTCSEGGDIVDKYIVEMKEIVKTFGSVVAIKDGQFNLRSGEIHSLIGENGAGKSTMMKLLYGMYDLDFGEIYLDGQKQAHLTPKEAISRGIGMVHQEFMLVQELTVLENVILGFEPTNGMKIDFVKAREEVQRYIDTYGMDVQLDKRISQISLGEAQRVEIIKILMRGAKIIILDEPTAVLTPQEAEGLFKILAKLKQDGRSIVFISHKLDEVMEISDRISVMRQGGYIGTVDKEDTNEAELARMMIGRDVFLDIKRQEAQVGEVLLEVEDLWTSSEKEISKIRGLDLQVRKGEIVGIAGIDGNGQSELVEAITGLRKSEKGEIVLDGEKITNLNPKEVRAKGIAHVPEDRNTRGLNRLLSIQDNLVSVSISEKPFSSNTIINKKAILENAKEAIKKFDIRPTDPTLRTSAMSGGNAQKVVVAREVKEVAKLLIAAQPTRGVDIGAIESIREILQDVKKTGVGILLISADLQEIMSLSDRILVMYEGEISGELTADEANEEVLGLLMMGGKNKDEAREVE